MKDYALLLVNFKKYFPLSPKYITNIDIDEYKYSYTCGLISNNSTFSPAVVLISSNALNKFNIGINYDSSIALRLWMAMLLMKE